MRQKAGGLLSRCFRSRAMSAAIALCVVLLFLICLLTDSLAATKAYVRKATYGYHNGVVFDCGYGGKSQLQKHAAVEAVGTMEIYRQIVDAGGNKIGSIGCVDAAFQSLEQLSFLEGTYPTDSTEIAMELTLLDQLHLPYTLGQKVTLTLGKVREDGQVITSEQEYTLCGILDTWTPHWLHNGYDLCGALVSDFPEPAAATHVFFLSTHADETELRELSAIVPLDKGELVYNSYAYPSFDLTTENLLEAGAGITAVSVLCFLFLLCCQISRRKEEQYRIRVIKLLGGGRATLLRSVVGAALTQWGKAFPVSALGCTVFALLVKTALQNSAVQCTWDIKAYWISGGLSFAVVISGSAIQLFSSLKTGILPPGRDLTRLETDIKCCRRPGGAFSMRQFRNIETQRMKRHFNLEMGCVCTGVVIFLLCFFVVFQNYRVYRLTSQLQDYDYAWLAGNSGRGLTAAQVQQIKDTENIVEVAYANVRDVVETAGEIWIYLSYAGVEEDRYTKYINDRIEIFDTQQGVAVTVVALPEGSSLWEYYVPDDMDVEAFLNGETCILYAAEIVEDGNGSYTTVNTYEFAALDGKRGLLPHVSIGQELMLTAGEKSVQVACGAILTRFPSTLQNSRELFTTPTVFISQSLYEQWFQMEQESYNMVLAYGNGRLSYDVTDKKMAEVSQEASVAFTNHTVELRHLRQNFLQLILLQGTVILLAMGAVLTICYRSRVSFLTEEAPRISLLKRLGMEAADRKKLYRGAQTKKILCFLCFGNLAALAAWCVIGYLRYAAVIRADSILAAGIRILNYIFLLFPWPLYISSQLALCLLVLLVFRKAGKKYWK